MTKRVVATAQDTYSFALYFSKISRGLDFVKLTPVILVWLGEAKPSHAFQEATIFLKQKMAG